MTSILICLDEMISWIVFEELMEYSWERLCSPPPVPTTSTYFFWWQTRNTLAEELTEDIHVFQSLKSVKI